MELHRQLRSQMEFGNEGDMPLDTSEFIPILIINGMPV
jgi:hypothetical protein